MKSKLSWGLSALIIIALALVAVRIVWLNMNAPKFQVEKCGLGEWIDLSGTFMSKVDDVNNDKFSVRVNSVRTLSERQFYEEYQPDADLSSKSEVPNSIVELDVSFKNEGEESSEFNGLDQHLVSGAKTFVIDAILDAVIAGSESEDPEGIVVYQIHPGREVQRKVCYVMNVGETWREFSHNKEGMYLLLANAPRRITVDLSAGAN